MNDITLTVTVSGPNPWNKTSERLVSGILGAIGEDAVERLSSLHAADKPPDWQQVTVAFEVSTTDDLGSSPEVGS